MPRIIALLFILTTLLCNENAQDVFLDTESAIMEKESLYKSDLMIYRNMFMKGDTEFLNYVLKKYQLYSLNKQELRILRNCIYAKHGYIFSDITLSELFKKYPWYTEKSRNVDDLLLDVDKYNIKLIQLVEKTINTESHNPINENELVGMWHIMPIVGSGYSERYFFYKNGKFAFKNNQMDGSTRLVGFNGTWKIERNNLILFAKEMDYMYGGKIVKPYASYGSKYVIANGKTKHEKLSDDIVLSLSIGIYNSADNLDGRMSYSIPSIQIGVEKYWRMYQDPYQVKE
jgi:hypothetical protein